MLDSRITDAPTEHDDPPPATPGRRPWAGRAALLVPGVVMLILALWGLGRDDAMGNDEVASRWLAGLPLGQLRHVLHHLDAVHGLYYVILHGWLVFGRSPTAIRVPSVIASVLAVIVVAALVRRLTGSTLAGVTAGLVGAVCPLVSYYAQTARSYALVYLVVALATYVLVHSLDRERNRPAIVSWLTYGVLIVISGYLNELSLLVLAAHLVTVLVSGRGRWAMVRWLSASVIAVAIVYPLIHLSQQQSMVLDYLTAPGAHEVNLLFEGYFGGTLAVAIALAVLAAAGLLARFPGRERRLSPATVGLPLVILPAALLMLYSQVASSLYAERYVLFGEIGVAVLAGSGIAWLAKLVCAQLPVRPPVAASAAALVCVVVGAAVFAGGIGPQSNARTPQSRQFDFGGPAAFVASGARPGDGVLFFSSFFRKTRLGYPGDFRDTVDLAQAVPPERTANFIGRNKPFSATREAMLGHRRIWVVGKPPGSVANLGPRFRLEAALLLQRYARVAQRSYGKIHVTLWRRLG